MFTGLVECVGTVVALRAARSAQGVSEIAVSAPKIARELHHGDSVAVSGACLTVVETSGDVMTAQMMPETLRATKLGSLSAGDPVNLERAMQAGGRLDGHIVQGHVDEVGRVISIEGAGSGTIVLRASMSEKISWGIARKGSICIDGVSLTVVESSDDEFSVGLIPVTMAETSLGRLRPGSPINIEVDVLARYLARMMGIRTADSTAGGSSLTWERLAEYGWA